MESSAALPVADVAVRMHITVVPTADEVRRSRAVIAKRVLTRNYSDAIVIGIYIASAAIAYLIAPSTWLITSGLAIMAVVVAIWSLQAEAKRRARRLYAEDPHALEEYQLSVDANGVRAWCAHVDTRYTWDGFTRVRETSEFYLFLRPLGGVAIPKRAVDAEAEEELRQLIRRWSPDRGESLAREVATIV
jgi:hypothetical protein